MGGYSRPPGDPKTPQKQMFHGETFFFQIHPRGTGARTCIMMYRMIFRPTRYLFGHGNKKWPRKNIQNDNKHWKKQYDVKRMIILSPSTKITIEVYNWLNIITASMQLFGSIMQNWFWAEVLFKFDLHRVVLVWQL